MLKKVFVVYLIFKLKWCPAFLYAKSGNPISVPFCGNI